MRSARASLCVLILVLGTGARASATDLNCVDAPRNAMYRVIADGCPGDSARRLSTGFRVGPSLYATLHGILGCTGEIVAYPQCPIAGNNRIVLVPKKVARSWDLVQLSPKTGSLRGPELVIQNKKPNDQERFWLCGYPQWNNMQPTCSQAFAFDHSQSGILGDLLEDGGDKEARKRIRAFGLPDLKDVVLWHEALGGGGVSGGPLVIQSGNHVFAVHDGRFDSQGRERYWAIPLSDAIVWQSWKSFAGDAETKEIVARQLPGWLHVAPIQEVTQGSIPAEKAQAFLIAFFESIFGAYGCEWMRTGTELVNQVCATGVASCQSSTAGGDADAGDGGARDAGANDAGARDVCPMDCVLGVYAHTFGNLKPVSQLLCQQFAREADISPARLGCWQPDAYTWYAERKDLPFGTIFMNGAMQFGLMRELYFAGLPDARRDDLVAARLAIWADDASKRHAIWRMDAAKSMFEQWHAAKLKSFEIQDRNGVPFYLDPSDDWVRLQSQLFEFVASAAAAGQVSVTPTCTNARMIFNDAGTWNYTIGRVCPASRCLAFADNAILPRREAVTLAAALVFGGSVKMDLRLRPAGHAVAHMTGPAPGPKTSLELRLAPCTSQPQGLPLRSCDITGPGNDWTCQADVHLSEDCSTVEARVLVGDAVVRRQAISIHQK
jgi:hypothetical protein